MLKKFVFIDNIRWRAGHDFAKAGSVQAPAHSNILCREKTSVAALKKLIVESFLVPAYDFLHIIVGALLQALVRYPNIDNPKEPCLTLLLPGLSFSRHRPVVFVFQCPFKISDVTRRIDL